MDISCYSHIIGLSSSGCNCYGIYRPEDYNESLSGLYITDLMQLKQINELESCEKPLIWSILDTARDNAIRAFISDTNALLMNNFSLERQPFYGGIGQKKARDNRSIDELYGGIRIKCARINSGVMIVKNIGTIFNETGTVILHIYNNFNEKVGDDITLNVVANTPTDNVLSTPIELPLFSKHGDLEYFFVYLLTKTPKANLVNCNCGQFKPSFSSEMPYYKWRHVGVNAWANFIMVGGFETDSLTDFDQDMPVNASNYMNGLFLDLELKCKVQETLCKDGLDFEGNPLAISMAYAIRYKAAELIADAILSSGDPDVQTLVNAEGFAEAREEWIDKYNEMTTYIASNVSVQTSDCLCEKNVFGLTSKGVFS